MVKLWKYQKVWQKMKESLVQLAWTAHALTYSSYPKIHILVHVPSLFSSLNPTSKQIDFLQRWFSTLQNQVSTRVLNICSLVEWNILRTYKLKFTTQPINKFKSVLLSSIYVVESTDVMSGTISVSRREKKSRNWIRISFYLRSFFVHIQHWTHEIQFHLKIILESGYNVFTDQIVFYHSIRKIGSNCRKTYRY